MLQITDHLQQRRKTPRVALAFDSRFLQPLRGVSVLWEDRSLTQVFDLSLTGMILEKNGVLREILAKAKPGSLFSVKLKFDGHLAVDAPEERLSLDLRVIELGVNFVSAMIDSISSEGRLRLTQILKDAFVIENFQDKSHPDEMLRIHPEFANWRWYHSAFDTNILILREKANQQDTTVQALILEYDTLCLRFDSEGLRIQRSFAMAEWGDGYSQLWQRKQTQKVAMGASWSARLERLLESAEKRHPEMAVDLLSARHFLQAMLEG